MKGITIKWADTDKTAPEVYNLFKITAKALGLTLFEAAILAMKEFNITHRGDVEQFLYKVPEVKEKGD